MLSYHNDPKVKETYLARMRRHRETDRLVRSQYWENGKGCAIGCLVHGDSHILCEAVMGIPCAIFMMVDCIFEGLPRSQAMLWPERFLEAVPVGVDLSLVWPRMALWLLDQMDRGKMDEGELAAVENVRILYTQGVAGVALPDAVWNQTVNDLRLAYMHDDGLCYSVAYCLAYAGKSELDDFALDYLQDAINYVDDTSDGFYPALADELIRQVDACTTHVLALPIANRVEVVV